MTFNLKAMLKCCETRVLISILCYVLIDLKLYAISLARCKHAHTTVMFASRTIRAHFFVFRFSIEYGLDAGTWRCTVWPNVIGIGQNKRKRKYARASARNAWSKNIFTNQSTDSAAKGNLLIDLDAKWMRWTWLKWASAWEGTVNVEKANFERW